MEGLLDARTLPGAGEDPALMDEALAERGILRGSGIGLVIGTLYQFFEIYFKRRKSSR